MAGQEDGKKLQITIFGLLKTYNFHVAKTAAETLQQNDPIKFENLEINGLLECDWHEFITTKKKEIKEEFWGFNDDTVVFVNGEVLGSTGVFVAWATKNFDYEDYRPLPLYEAMACEAYKDRFENAKHDFVYMDVTINDESAGKLVFELYTDICPKTCQNFRELCSSTHQREDGSALTYKNTLFHRILKGGWVQAGDVIDGSGANTESIYGPVFEDENFSVHHDRRGILGMANKGRHTNGSQFYITLSPAKWMDTKFVAFGRLVEGNTTLMTLEAQKTYNERPTVFCRIADSGIYKAD
ncbi:uncharacterized protein TRIADDRAFT_24929 [Trichoplax adhaerens]|uniref:Peptidyl-prolyl cis-trans isomerase n=1 Tax=Trichoplax adhaerens TaxID=10228 RepID=B3RWE1_TRIAD|nr:hypothetical protein TRIADDRAFT_24929 [Trichoplax adhaerens]EDV25121.1 hypothetical protein TRIADDRAFT_24929 [Trichoplax adhaerens]|eukprot:XP_002113011.1 hypothetical protein TRIADDRAFT_24929 [Trichoplax adhaerens]